MAERLSRRNLDAWILVPGANLRYFTDLRAHPSERLLLLVQPAVGAPFAVVPHFESGRVRAELGPEAEVRLFPYRDESGPGPALARAFGSLSARTAVFGAEFGTMRLFERAAVESAVPRARWQDIDPDALFLRQIKDPHEIGLLGEAAAIARCAAEAGLAALRPGRTEREVAAACREVLHRFGTDSPFGVMVASGPRAADPHAGASDRVLQAGDVVWIDVGAEVDGYCGDVTRTGFVPGAPGDSRLVSALAVAGAAQRAALASLHPGVTAGAIDAAARGVIAQAGLGASFTHRTGHGLGLQPHEAPYLVDGSEEPLLAGMVFTVEPGIYLAGVGGVRVEDSVLVTGQGAEVLGARAPQG